MNSICNEMMTLLTKPYEFHMIDFLIDSERYIGMVPEDFKKWQGRVLLILRG